jgi:hypothetical protein
VNDQQLRAYLLGQLSEGDAERLEARLLDDQETFEALEGVEDDLFDDFARGRLDAAERAKFLERYAGQPARVRFARALAERSARASVVSFPRRQWLPLAAAAALAIAAGGVLMRPERAPQPLPSAAPPPPSAVLRLGTSRSAGAASDLSLPPDAPTLELRVRLDPADRFDRYSMELRSPAGENVWRVDDLKASPDAGELDLLASVPARPLASGTYELAVRGAHEASPPEDLGFATLKITRRSP